jgi:hypothetical protein
VDHSWVGDFVAKITSPTASAVTLLSRPGGVNNSGHNFCRTTLDDSAASSIQAITAAGQPYTGSFIPFSPLTAFNGQNPNGTWTLNISDQAAADTGNLRAWSLSIRTLACNAPLPGPGTVPSAAPSTPLTVAKSGSNVTLAWGASCSSSGVDYAIYQGTIGTFTSHASKFCSTQGLLSKTFSMDPGNLYYLVTALTAEREGSYGQATSGERPAAASPCKPQLLGACP